jgi:hypothetical protein
LNRRGQGVFGRTRQLYWDLFLEQAQKVDALGTLNRHAKNAIPDQLGQGAKSTADTESDGVVKGLLEAKVMEEDTASGIDVGVWVLSL